MTNTSTERTMLAHYGYIDRRDQNNVRPEDRLAALPGSPTRRSDVRVSTSRTLGLPETSRQANRFERYRSHYSNLGLCDRCAPLAAYGHQHGFTALTTYETRSPYAGLLIDSGAPCQTCHSVVNAFPDSGANGWRSNGPEKARNLRTSASGHSETTSTRAVAA